MTLILLTLIPNNQAGAAEIRIIPLYSAFSEILQSIGAQSAIVGKTKNDNTPLLQGLPVVGTHMRPSLERILALRPDLVVQLTGREDAALTSEALRHLGVSVLDLPLATLEDLFQAIEILGEKTKRTNEARACVCTLKERLQEIENRSREKKKIGVFFEIRSPSLLAAGSRNIVNHIIAIAGGENVVHSAKKIVRLSDEELLRMNPSAYVIQKGPMNPDPVPLEKRPALSLLEAAQKKRVLLVEESLFSHPSPNIVQACDMLEQWLHSPLFERN